MPRTQYDGHEVCPLVSVVVPVYNVGQFVDQCVRSICQQTYVRLEVILIDDGSCDDSGAICDDWVQRDARVEAMHQKNSGQAAARNAGIEKCKGEYILCVDSDDYLHPDLIRRCISVMERDDSDICVFRFRFVSQDGSSCKEAKRFQKFPQHTPSTPEQSLPLVIQDRLPSYPWSFIARRQLYKDNSIAFPVGRLMEDRGTTYRLFGSAHLISFVDSYLYSYRVRTGSTLTSKVSLLAEDEFKNFTEMEAYIANQYPKLSNLMGKVWIWNSALNLRRLMKYRHEGIMANSQTLDLEHRSIGIIRAKYRELGFRKLGFNELLIVCFVVLHIPDCAALYTFFVECVGRKRRPSLSPGRQTDPRGKNGG